MDQDAKAKYNKPENGGKAGTYTHPNVPGEILEVREFPAADALLRQGWVRSGDLPTRVEIAERNKKALEEQIAAAKKSEGNSQLEAVNSELASAKAEAKANGGDVNVEEVTAGEPTHPAVDTGPSTKQEVPSAEVTKNTPKALKESK